MQSAATAHYMPVANALARHPMRRMLPPPPRWMRAPPVRTTAENVRLFLLAYGAGFLAFYSFIS